MNSLKSLIQLEIMLVEERQREVIGLGKPFKDREEVKTDISRCDYAAAVWSIVGIILASIGVIGDAFDIALILEPTSWLLLAIFAGLGAMMTHLNYLTAKHLYGIESERR